MLHPKSTCIKNINQSQVFLTHKNIIKSDKQNFFVAKKLPVIINVLKKITQINKINQITQINKINQINQNNQINKINQYS